MFDFEAVLKAAKPAEFDKENKDEAFEIVSPVLYDQVISLIRHARVLRHLDGHNRPLNTSTGRNLDECTIGMSMAIAAGVYLLLYAPAASESARLLKEAIRLSAEPMSEEVRDDLFEYFEGMAEAMAKRVIGKETKQ